MNDFFKILVRKLNYLKLLGLFILFSSCKTIYNLNLQILTPAQVSIPAYIDTVVIVNHSNYQKSIFLDSEMHVRKNTDSLYSNEYLAGLNDVIDNSPRFVVANDNAVYILKDGYSQRFRPLSWKEVDGICKKYNAKAVITLESFTIPQKPVAVPKYMPGYGMYYARVTVENSSLWKIYEPSQRRLIDDYTLSDTMSWESYGLTNEELEQGLPDKDEIMYESCYQAGSKYGRRIGQVWEKVSRILYDYPNSDFQKALDLAKANKWLEAAEIWKKYPYGNKKNLAALASFNLAVACEALDNIDAALDWAAKSYLLKNDIVTQKYISILEKRKRQKSIIEKQIQ
jgi:hypothetical protein